MARGKLRQDIVAGNAGFDHQDEHMIDKIGDLIDGVALVLRLSGDDDLGRFFADLFQDLVKPFSNR